MLNRFFQHYTANIKSLYKLLKADVEYFGNSNFGKLLLQLQGEAEENQQAIYYFNQNKIQNTVKGYA